jgi:hypothetical protein
MLCGYSLRRQVVEQRVERYRDGHAEYQPGVHGSNLSERAVRRSRAEMAVDNSVE